MTPPKDPAKNRLFRAWLLRRAVSNTRVQKHLVEESRRDVLFFVDAFVFQYNPRVRGDGAVGPFIAWDFQEDDLQRIDANIEADRDLVIQKSREVGGTWQVLIAIVRRCVVFRWQSFLCVSHSEKAVYAPGDKNSIFYKIEFITDRLPTWLAGSVGFTKLGGFTFPNTESSITGAATTQKAGVGGRVTAVFLDEFALQPDDAAIWGATADLGARIVCSTHYSLGAKFHHLCQTAHEDRRDMIVTHWSQHPMKKKGLYRSDPSLPGGYQIIDTGYQFPEDYPFVKDGKPSGGPREGIRSPWYDSEVRRRGSLRDVALHLDIDCEGATAQFADPALLARLIRDCRSPLWEGFLDFDPSGRPVRLVQQTGGAIKLWMYPTPDGQVPFGLYGFGIDPATGLGATATCMSGGNAETGEKVFEYRDPFIKPHDMAVFAVAACWLFRTIGGQGAKLAVECPGPGLDVIKRVLELGYQNIHRHMPDGDTRTMNAEGKPGFYTTPQSKATLLREHLSALSVGHVRIYSTASIKELGSYAYTPKTGLLEHGQIESKDDPSGARMNHGDLAYADALMSKMLRSLGLGKPEALVVIDTKPKRGSIAGRMEVQRMRERELELMD